MEQMEQILRKAIAASTQPNTSVRQGIYERARQSIANLHGKNDAASIDELNHQLKITIDKIEGEFSAIAEIEPIVLESPAEAIEEFQQFNARQPSPQSNAHGSVKWVIAMSILAVVGLVVTYFYIDSPKLGASKTQLTYTFDNIDETYLAQATKARPATKQKASLTSSSHEGKKTLVVKRTGSLFVEKFVEVDTSKIYKLSIKLRIRPKGDLPVRTRTLVGLATYDADKKLQTSKPGAHRYGTLNRTISSAKGWQVYSGVFTGAGDGKRNLLRTGTRYVRPMILFNRKAGPDVETEIAWLKFEEIEAPASD